MKEFGNDPIRAMQERVGKLQFLSSRMAEILLNIQLLLDPWDEMESGQYAEFFGIADSSTSIGRAPTPKQKKVTCFEYIMFTYTYFCSCAGILNWCVKLVIGLYLDFCCALLS